MHSADNLNHESLFIDNTKVMPNYKLIKHKYNDVQKYFDWVIHISQKTNVQLECMYSKLKAKLKKDTH